MDAAEGDMLKAYILASAIKGKLWIQQHKWGKQLPCKASDIQSIENKLTDNLYGINGYTTFAMDAAEGDMLKAYQLASAIKGKLWIQQQKWGKQLPCKASDIPSIENKLTDNLYGIDGYT